MSALMLAEPLFRPDSKHFPGPRTNCRALLVNTNLDDLLEIVYPTDPNKSTESVERGMAHHEAGHSVVGVIVGDIVERVFYSCLTLSGFVVHAVRDGDGKYDIGVLIANAAVLLAGRFAYERSTGDAKGALASAAHDEEDLVELFKGLPQSLADGIKDNASSVATFVIGAYWPVVCEVAHRLLDDGQVWGETVHDLVERFVPAVDPRGLSLVQQIVR